MHVPKRKYRVVGRCFLAGVHPTAAPIDRVVEARSDVQAAYVAFGGFHRDIWVRDDKAGRFTGMFGNRACGAVTITEVKS